MAKESIFTRIIRGEIPSYKVYEDEDTFAFLDIHPKQPGHVLVIPKKEIDHIWDLPDEDYQALMATSKKVAQRIREIINPRRVAMQVEGTGVPHAHVHIFPFSTVEEFHAEADMDRDPDHQALSEMAAKLAF
ncbi:MAG: putative Histidine triad protein [Candidatus Saccharibacteria bacterium]|nr:putative Histidine triad protein [Candidatus Saccharibacteria bacterium]